MKTKLFFFVIALFAASAMFAQSTTPTTSDCSKKFLKEIKKNMNMINVVDYVKEDHRIYVVLTCDVDENKNVVPVKAEGINEKLNEAVIQNLEDHPITCSNPSTGKPFTILLNFKHISWESL